MTIAPKMCTKCGLPLENGFSRWGHNCKPERLIAVEDRCTSCGGRGEIEHMGMDNMDVWMWDCERCKGTGIEPEGGQDDWF